VEARTNIREHHFPETMVVVAGVHLSRDVCFKFPQNKAKTIWFDDLIADAITSALVGDSSGDG
jgi:hypothetical protein